MSFVVFSLPRSRSAWLSLFLSRYVLVGHDVGPDSSSVEDFLERIGGGSCETGAAFAWPLLRRLRPEVRFAVVRRPVDQVLQSLWRFGFSGDALRDEIAARDRCLDEIAAMPTSLVVDYDELDHYAACRDLFEFCTGDRCDPAWFKRMRPLNVQVDMAMQMQKLAQNHDHIEAMKAQAMEMMADA